MDLVITSERLREPTKQNTKPGCLDCIRGNSCKDILYPILILQDENSNNLAVVEMGKTTTELSKFQQFLLTLDRKSIYSSFQNLTFYYLRCGNMVNKRPKTPLGTIQILRNQDFDLF